MYFIRVEGCSLSRRTTPFIYSKYCFICLPYRDFNSSHALQSGCPSHPLSLHALTICLFMLGMGWVQILQQMLSAFSFSLFLFFLFFWFDTIIIRIWEGSRAVGIAVIKCWHHQLPPCLTYYALGIQSSSKHLFLTIS